MGFFSRAFGRVASIILDIDDTQQPKEQIAALNDFLARNRFDIETTDLVEFLGLLKKKHLVDSITISRAGEVVASSSNNGIGDSFASAALLEFVAKQISKPETILLKMANHWFMVFPFGQNIYIVKASTNLSTIELRAVAREIEEFLKKEKIGKGNGNHNHKKETLLMKRAAA
ncbi:MAG TPA: hypothetical protein VI977_03315 [archaeon]|nr:hypothetical protein [archaeon]